MLRRIGVSLLFVGVTLLMTTQAGALCTTCSSENGVFSCPFSSSGGRGCITDGVECYVAEACGSGPVDLQPRLEPRLRSDWLVNPRGITRPVAHQQNPSLKVQLSRVADQAGERLSTSIK